MGKRPHLLFPSTSCYWFGDSIPFLRHRFWLQWQNFHSDPFHSSFPVTHWPHSSQVHPKGRDKFILFCLLPFPFPGSSPLPPPSLDANSFFFFPWVSHLSLLATPLPEHSLLCCLNYTSLLHPFLHSSYTLLFHPHWHFSLLCPFQTNLSISFPGLLQTSHQGWLLLWSSW